MNLAFGLFRFNVFSSRKLGNYAMVTRVNTHTVAQQAAQNTPGMDMVIMTNREKIPMDLHFEFLTRMLKHIIRCVYDRMCLM